MSWRKLLVLIDHLPPEGALNTAIRNATPEDQLALAVVNPAQSPWSMVELLLAQLIDEVREGNWMYASVHSKTAPKRPEPIKRPGSKQRRGRKVMRMSEVRALDPRLRHLSDDEIRKLMNSPIVREDATNG